LRDLQEIVESYIMHHQERMDLIWRALHKRPRPVYDLVKEVLPFMPEDHIFLGVSEIMSHLEVLIREDKVTIIDTGPPSLFRTV
jgi:hypothetical protein